MSGNYLFKGEKMLKKNQELEARIVDLTYEGKGVAKVEDYPLFIEDALPGEVVKLLVLKANKNYGFAKVLEYITTSSQRRENVEKKYLQTGIAPLQHLSYDGQLLFKKQQVINCLHKFKLNVHVDNTSGMADPSHYRNKAQVPVRKQDNHLVTGFYKKKSHDFIALTDFYLHETGIDEALQSVCRILDKYRISAYNEQNHEGILRHIVVRKGHYTKQLMITLVTRKSKLFKGEQLAQEIIEQVPNVVSVMQNVNPDKTNVILGKETKLLAGDSYLVDTMLGQTFHISAPAFYQVNTEQAEKLYHKALELADLKPTDIAIDAYCGIGTITLAIAPHVKKVYGVEVVPDAILDAKKNAQLNNINNVEFTCNKAETQLQIWQQSGINPNVIFVDPPRKGLDHTFIETLRILKPRKIVYISCNPATFARDIDKLRDLYDLSTVYPYDLFPETTHVEVVSCLELKA